MLRLLLSRSQVEEILNRHLEEGRTLQDRADGIATSEGFATWDRDRDRWTRLTEEGLRAAFADEDVIHEFEVAAQPIMVIGTTTDEEFGYAQRAIADGFNVLISLRERLEYARPPNADAIPASESKDLSEAQVFVVHGHDDGFKDRVARLLERTGNHAVTILHEQPNRGRTLIEKFEEHAADVGYAVILLTGDDEGGLVGADDLHPRARQNVVFELGFFFGGIGRARVAALYRPGVELPSDVEGVVYIEVDDSDRWQLDLLRELRDAGLDFDLNKLP